MKPLNFTDKKKHDLPEWDLPDLPEWDLSDLLNWDLPDVLDWGDLHDLTQNSPKNNKIKRI